MTKLYNMDLDKQEWREGKFKRGDTWRSDAIYECDICLTQSNSWVMGGWPGMGPRLVCEGTKYTEHKTLHKDIKEQYRLGELIKEAEGQSKAKESLGLVDAELELIDIRISNLRERFGEQHLHDIEGNPTRVIKGYVGCSSYMGNISLPEKPLSGQESYTNLEVRIASELDPI